MNISITLEKKKKKKKTNRFILFYIIFYNHTFLYDKTTEYNESFFII